MKFSKFFIQTIALTSVASETIREAIIGRWELIDSDNVAEYIDNEKGGMMYTIFAKKMKPDVEYIKLAENSYLAKIYLSISPFPIKIPLRLDEEYKHKNPTDESVKSVPEVTQNEMEIILQTKGGSEGPVEQSLKIMDGKLIHRMKMLDKNITATRIYKRKNAKR
ncbi:Oidioi.mRNA.OKI2018_I69.chr1.g1873.t1.cds [Oikopleura dioica]|uniref:Oidioi.mRNA.OKI2018_I69.chr1.g1873.t1.cds n=1 Tax=Oikopleura dioica TaxID=34765 RepID=A0ABN7SPA6_OIKDI|nr:Oidioi.mRNA.OKI2018_I69.chr1.g1873.t1.cds [Oikopleura dioica]